MNGLSLKRYGLVGALLLCGVCAAAKPKERKMTILFVMSGVDYVTDKDGGRHKTGYWAEEFVVPYRALKKAGVRVIVATPGGVAPTADPLSFEPANWKSPEELLAAKKTIETAAELLKPRALGSLTASELGGFHAVFYPGGHAPMEDLVKDADSGRVLRHFHAKGKPTALICHGPIALLSAKEGDRWPYAGYKMTVFSDSEEKQSHLAAHLRYSVEAELKKNGGVYQGGKDWQPTVVEDRELITAQNPMSSADLAKALLEKLNAAPSK